MIRYEIVATTGSYTNANGEEKRRYENVGHVHQHEGRFYITLRATFNPAGLPRKEGDDRVFLNLYEPKEKEAPKAQKSMDEDEPF